MDPLPYPRKSIKFIGRDNGYTGVGRRMKGASLTCRALTRAPAVDPPAGNAYLWLKSVISSMELGDL